MIITPLGHSSVKIKSNLIIYLDPFKIQEDKADLILITHTHYDHFSIEDINKLKTKDTIIITSKDANIDSIKLSPNQEITEKGIKIQTIPCYNEKFHPKEKHWLSYILTIENKKILFLGDCNFMEEFKQINNIDLLFIPIGGTYTMNYKEAFEAVKIIKPKLVIPTHFGKIVGTKEDANHFIELCKEINIKATINEVEL